MILDTLTKFNYRRKMWMTPEHPFCLREKNFKVMYGAGIILQAQMNQKVSPLDNYELERLLKAGLKLEASDIAWAMRSSGENGVVVDYLIDNIKTDKERAIFMLDLINVSMNDGEMTENGKESIELFAKMFYIPGERVKLLQKFIEYALEENIEECQRFAGIIGQQINNLEISDLKYYIMQLTENSEFTQQILNEKNYFRLLDRCTIYEDIVLKEGMSLVIDNAVVRVYGNISLEGGELIIQNSKIVRKSGSHRACINIHSSKSTVKVLSVEADCRNYGMFIRAEEGSVDVRNSSIYRTTRGAAIRFWGKNLNIEGTDFYECYSPEDGGAVMVRDGSASIRKCRFKDCEAKRGGAVYGITGTVISECKFLRCNVAEYGAAVFYSGIVGKNAEQLKFYDCHPEGAEIIQHIAENKSIRISKGDFRITVSTIVDCPVSVESGGGLLVENANIYLNYPIHCSGRLIMKNVKVICGHLESGDMIYLENAKECNIYHCELDGMLKTGGLNILSTRIAVHKSLFKNMGGGRAIYNAYQPEITDCIFNFCQKGAIYSQGGKIERCVFINCRAKCGAGIQLYGMKGNAVIDTCNFRRCVSEYDGGAIDKAVSTKILRCLFEDCKPNNVS